MTRLTDTPSDFTELTGCFLAGGAILSHVMKAPVNDWDIYPKSLQDFENTLHYFLTEHTSQILNITDRAITLKCNDFHGLDGRRAIVQIISFAWFKTAKEIFESFDFTACMAAWDYDTKEYAFHNDFYPDVASKTLRFNNKTAYPLASIVRTNKYQHKGFKVGRMEWAKMSIAMGQKKLPQSWRELESQLGGVYGRQITLSTNDIEFTIDNAISALSDCSLDFDQESKEHETKYGKYTAVDVIAYYQTLPVVYHPVDKDFAIGVNGFFLTSRIPQVMLDDIGIPENFSMAPSVNVFGYANIYNITEINTRNVFTSTISVTFDKSKFKGSTRCYLISFKLSDIQSVGNDSVVVTNYNVKSLISDYDSGCIDDVYTVLSNEITS